MELNKTFIDGLWSKEINVTSFVQTNITPYLGDASFLAGPTERTKHIWNLCLKALEEERQHNGVRALDNKTVSTVTSHKAGYIDRENELIVGLQTDELLKRAIKPFGGINVVSRACKENGVEVDEKVKDIFTHYRKTHNDGVFDVYTEEIRSFRSLGFLTGLPDNYARGRIIGDYRRLALYGTDRLIEAKQEDLRNLTGPMTDARIRLREEVAEQIKALKDIRTMGEYYGLDLSRPAHSAQEAVQWVYMAYLAAVKEQDGAAMSLGNVSSFLDIFIEYDLAHGTIDESFAQELIDQFVIKLRMVRHLRMQSYNDIFAGDPTWVTEAIGGRFNDGRTKVTKTSFRFLQTLYNLGPSPEPNLTILWSPELPQGFKDFCAKVSADTSSIQYENDDLMREVRHSDDYGIACCVSFQDIGRQIQFFGARTNLAKALLLAINEGRCENTGTLMVKGIPALSEGPLRFEEVMRNYKMVLKEIARVYNEAMNIIHYMHDKYYYEKAQMAFVDTDPRINLAYGVAGLSIALDSLSAIKYARVTPRRNAEGSPKPSTSRVNSLLRQQRRPCRPSGRGPRLLLQRGAEEAARLQERPTDAVAADDHLERDVRQEDRRNARRTPQGRGLRSGSQPDARPRQERRHRFARLGGQDALPRLAGRYFEHLLDRAQIARPDGRRAYREPRDDARRLFHQGCTPPERQRTEPRDARRRHGAPREISAADDPRLGLRRELHQVEPRTPARSHQPQLPRKDVTA